MDIPLPSIPGFTILRLLGAGSGGFVYQGQEEKSRQLCAVKVFPVRTETSRQFFRELSFLFSLDHPNIVRAVNLIYAPEGQHVLALEYADGGSLRDLLNAESTLDERRVLEVMLQVMQGLAHGHALQIIHRDLKPENVLLFGADRDEHRYKVSDYGLATCAADFVLHDRNHGSPIYMAPEQFLDRATSAVDVYAAGVMFFEMLTGAPPFQGNPERLFAAHMKDPVPLERLTSARYREVIGRMLAKQPSGRPEAEEVVQELACLLDGQATPLEVSAIPSPKCGRRMMARLRDVLPAIRDREIETPNAERLFPAESSGGVKGLWIADGRALDYADGLTGRLHLRVIGEPVFDHAFDPVTGRSLVLTRRFVHRIESWRGASSRLFPVQFAARRLVCDRVGRRMILAGASGIECLDAKGTFLWSHHAESYFFTPSPVVLPDGEVMVASGPVAPKVELLDEKGELQAQFEMPGPVMQLGLLEGHAVAVCSGMGFDEPATILRLARGREPEVIGRVMEGVYAARMRGDTLFFFCHDGSLRWRHGLTGSGQRLAIGKEITDALPLPEVNGLALLTGSGASARLHLIEALFEPSDSAREPYPESTVENGL